MLAAVLFDLDGTLVDTAPDLGHALNCMRARRDMALVPEQLIRGQASHGSQGLIKLGFGIRQTDPQFEHLRQEFLALYAENLTTRSTLFPGMDTLLNQLEQRDIAWGVVTNKPARFSEPLLKHLGLRDRMACLVSGDTCPRPKPDPQPMWHASRTINVPVERCLYVGDAERDVQAARAVGMPVVVAMYGYLSEQDCPHEWSGDAYIQNPCELLDYPGLCP